MVSQDEGEARGPQPTPQCAPPGVSVCDKCPRGGCRGTLGGAVDRGDDQLRPGPSAGGVKVRETAAIDIKYCAFLTYAC